MRNNTIMWIGRLALVAIAVAQLACSKAIFSSSGGSNNKDTSTVTPQGSTTPDLTFINDSFERDDIYADITNNMVYGWRGFILDGANSFLSFTNNGAGATIPPANMYGPAFDGQRFLLMAGRNTGSNVENVQVISTLFDLSQYNTAILNFHYLLFGNTNTAQKPTKLQVQVCSGNINQCGVNSDALNAAALQSAAWTTVFDSDNDGKTWKGLNGQNQQVSDWANGNVVIDLTNSQLVPYPGAFTFKFVALVHDEAPVGTNNGGSGDDDKCYADHDGHHDGDHYDNDHHDDDHYDNDHRDDDHYDNDHHDDDNFNDERTISSTTARWSDHHSDDDDNAKPCHHDDDDNAKPCHHDDDDKSKPCHHDDDDHKKPCDNDDHKKPCNNQPQPPTTSNTIQSGVAVDLVVGTATTRTATQVMNGQ